jgi:hypothetical protein
MSDVHTYPSQAYSSDVAFTPVKAGSPQRLAAPMPVDSARLAHRDR